LDRLVRVVDQSRQVLNTSLVAGTEDRLSAAGALPVHDALDLLQCPQTALDRAVAAAVDRVAMMYQRSHEVLQVLVPLQEGFASRQRDVGRTCSLCHTHDLVEHFAWSHLLPLVAVLGRVDGERRIARPSRTAEVAASEPQKDC